MIYRTQSINQSINQGSKKQTNNQSGIFICNNEQTISEVQTRFTSQGLPAKQQKHRIKNILKRKQNKFTAISWSSK